LTFITHENNLIFSTGAIGHVESEEQGQTIHLSSPQACYDRAWRSARTRKDCETLGLERSSGLDLPHHKGGPTDHNTTTAASISCGSGAAVGFTFLTLGNTFVTGLLLKCEHPKVVHSPSSLLLHHTDDRHLLAPD
jgi:hypothetical protein